MNTPAYKVAFEYYGWPKISGKYIYKASIKGAVCDPTIGFKRSSACVAGSKSHNMLEGTHGEQRLGS